MRRALWLLVSLNLLGLPLAVHAQGFAALVSPPRFELKGAPGKTLRGVIEISNRSTQPAKYLVRTADWTFAPDFTVNFSDALGPDSCRPWVSIERPEVAVPGAGSVRYRFEIAVPADVIAGECRFAVMIEGADPSFATSKGLAVPVTGRIGVIVYVTIADGAPILEVFGPKVETVNGQKLPTLMIHNSGNAHGRVAGYLTGKDANGVSYDFAPSDFPILPSEQREVFLTPSNGKDEHPTLAFPVRVKGTLEWADQKTELDQTFE